MIAEHRVERWAADLGEPRHLGFAEAGGDRARRQCPDGGGLVFASLGCVGARFVFVDGREDSWFIAPAGMGHEILVDATADSSERADDAR